MIFVDTSAWCALYVKRDANHAVARSFAAQFSDDVFTIDYVIDETLTLFCARGEKTRALTFGHLVFEEKQIPFELVSPDDFIRAWSIFHSFRDKNWSFTDCASIAVMERLGIRQAFAFDHHFHQFGTVEVVPAPSTAGVSSV